MEIENEFSFQRALSEKINLFLGSGFAVHAKDRDNRQLPTGTQLAKELVAEFKLHSAVGLDLPQVATILGATRRVDLRHYLVDRFTVGAFDDGYRAIERVRVEKIFTTNIDDLLFKVYSGSRTHYLNDLDLRGASFNDRTAVDIVTLHGCVLDDNRDFTFSATELASAFRRDPDRWHFLTQAMQLTPTLFWGYSLADSGTLEALHPTAVAGRALRDAWITVLPSADDATLSYFKALGLQIIRADTLELLAYLHASSPVQQTRVVHQPTEELLPEYAIPDITQVPVRSLFEFYRGAAPSWYEIFSGRLHRTKHHASLRNALSSGKHCIAAGVPGCGKTTLLMQVAADFAFPGHKLFCSAPTVEKASFIAATLRGEPALVFIDDFADSADALVRLMGTTNVQVVGADRHYNFEIASHLIPRDRLHVLDVTDLDDADVQQLFDHIPPEIRVRARVPFERETQPSLFEFVQSQVIGAKLRDRLRDVFTELRATDARLLQLLLVTAYVHSCRTAVSTDMLVAYFRNLVDDYRVLEQLRRKLGGMLVDYGGILDDGAQDYYVARSTLMAEAIMSEVSGRDLRQMLLRFHNEVSSYRIHRYDVFRRRAYDASRMNRAFDDWQEGLKFYRALFDREQSPYLLQQAALFLARKHRFTEAFSLIDEALVRSGNRIQSIRNSHAIILFSANYNKDDTELVRRTLQESMDILRDCYEQDSRKAYHAMTFADHALKYQDRYPQSPDAKEYLRIASGLLADQKKRTPWNRDLDRLIGVLRRRTAH